MRPRLLIISIVLGAVLLTGAAVASPLPGAVAEVNAIRSARALPPLSDDTRLGEAASHLASRIARSGTNGFQNHWIEQEVSAARYRWRNLSFAAFQNLTSVQELVRRMRSKRDMAEAVRSRLQQDIGIARVQAPNRMRNQGIVNVWVVLTALPDRAAPDNWRRALLAKVNGFRAEYGLPPLVLNTTLNRAAQYHADNMAANDYFAHISPNRRGPGYRAKRYGYNYRLVLENLAAGMFDPQVVLERWKASREGHREAMLNREVIEVGIGYRYHPNDKGRAKYFHYWAMTMGQPQ